jgi:hypothetical protein
MQKEKKYMSSRSIYFLPVIHRVDPLNLRREYHKRNPATFKSI